MYGTGNQFLAGAAFTRYQYVAFRGRHFANHPKDFFYYRRFAYDLSNLEAAVKLLLKLLVFLVQLDISQVLTYFQQYIIHHYRLDHVITGAKLYCLDGHLNRAESSYHYDTRLRSY